MYIWRPCDTKGEVMIELRGKYGTAKIFTDLVDEVSIAQVLGLLSQPFAENEVIRMMPDIHAGAGCVIGTTMTVRGGRICPNLVGVDIGCGMYAVKLEEKEIDCAKLDAVIRRSVPSGFDVRDTPHDNASLVDLRALFCAGRCDLDRAEKSIGTLGGGNHFIEVDRDSDGHLWIVIHSGSRYLGTQVASWYQDAAVKKLHTVDKNLINETIAELKKQGRQKDIQKTIAALSPVYNNIPDAFCWCEGELFEQYVHDMKITQHFAEINRRTMAEVIVSEMGFHAVDSFVTIHNYLDTEHMILRKGSVSARKGERLLIPMNMRDGSLICIGKGNDDWNQSAPHGAGRLMSRGKAKEAVSMKEYTDSMEGIWTSSVSEATIDESPMAYKPMDAIISNIGDTVDIVDVIRPVYNFKAG